MTPVEQAVLDAVERIPHGRVMSYGDVAEYVGSRAPRAVGQVLSRWGDEVPWHRVVTSTGRPAPHHAPEQLRLLAAEGVPVEGDRVVMDRARWSGGGRRAAR